MEERKERDKRICTYFNRPGGCNKGEECVFLHTALPPGTILDHRGDSLRGRGGARGRGDMRGRGRGGFGDIRGRGGSVRGGGDLRGRGGFRGRGRGGAFRGGRDEKPSFGVVPYFLINNEWYMLLQVSLSLDKADFKVDPFRGHVDEVDGDRPSVTAARELREQSFNLLTLNPETLESRAILIDDVYHVYLNFNHEVTLSEFIMLFNSNHIGYVSRSFGYEEGSFDHEDVEVLGVSFVRLDLDNRAFIRPHSQVRIASQVNRFLPHMDRLFGPAGSTSSPPISSTTITLSRAVRENILTFESISVAPLMLLIGNNIQVDFRGLLYSWYIDALNSNEFRDRHLLNLLRIQLANCKKNYAREYRERRRKVLAELSSRDLQHLLPPEGEIDDLIEGLKNM